jgi:hypothetical protein
MDQQCPVRDQRLNPALAFLWSHLRVYCTSGDTPALSFNSQYSRYVTNEAEENVKLLGRCVCLWIGATWLGRQFESKWYRSGLTERGLPCRAIRRVCTRRTGICYHQTERGNPWRTAIIWWCQSGRGSYERSSVKQNHLVTKVVSVNSWCPVLMRKNFFFC